MESKANKIKRFSLVISLLILTICLCACSEMAKPEDGLPDYISFDWLAEGYGVENAVEDDCVVFVDFKLILGEDIWKTFMTKAGKKQPCCVRIANYYSTGCYFYLSDLIYESSSFRVDAREYPENTTIWITKTRRPYTPTIQEVYGLPFTTPSPKIL